MAYIFIENGIINGSGDFECLDDDVINYEPTDELYKAFIQHPDYYLWSGQDVILNPDWEEIEQQKHRQEMDALTLTPADVERALYKAKGMDFEDLKALISQQIPTIDIKGLAIEFRARDFYRGATANRVRLFDTVGLLLGYTPDDMDYLFLNKELPIK